MIRPEIANVIKSNESPYSLVIAIAKRSRDIAAKSQDKKKNDDKPVNIAIEESCDHKVRLK